MSPGRIEEDTIISQPMMQKFGLLFLNSGSCKHVQSYAEAAEVVVRSAFRPGFMGRPPETR